MAARIWAQQAQIIPKMKIFAIFLSFNHNFFFKLNMMIACDNVKLSKQCKTLKQAKIKFKIRFFTIISRLVHNFLKNKAQNESLELCLTTSGDKTYEKNLERPKLGPKLIFYIYFLKFPTLFCLHITQDCSLGQCHLVQLNSFSLSKKVT